MNITIAPAGLVPYQMEFLYCKERFTVVEASTKTGKTHSHLWWIFERAMGGQIEVRAGMNFWWVAPIYSQAEIAMTRLRTKLVDMPAFTVNQSRLTITTPLGTVIHFKSADKPDNLYGEDVFGAVFDEFTRAKRKAWHALRSTLTHTKAPCKFIGNFTGSLNWGHKLGQKAKSDPNYKYFRITAYDAVREGILDAEEVEQAKKDLPKSVFEALYLAMGSTDGDVLFHPNKLEEIFVNPVVPSTKHYLSCDIASYGADRFVVVAWTGWNIDKVYSFAKMGPEEIEVKIRELAKHHKVPLTNIVFDGDGLGYYLRGYLKRSVAFVNGGKVKGKVNYLNLKTQCYYLLAKVIGDNKISCTDETHKEEIMVELEATKRDETQEGKLRILKKKDIKEILGHSPDYADAIMMRVLFDIPASLPKML